MTFDQNNTMVLECSGSYIGKSKKVRKASKNTDQAVAFLGVAEPQGLGDQQ
jgi:hypothetical protein